MLGSMGTSGGRTGWSQALSGTALVALGTVAGAERIAYWRPCWESLSTMAGSDVDSPVGPSVACLDASSFAALGDHLGTWAMAVLFVAVGLIGIRGTTSRALVIAAVALVLLALPFTDPGFFWQGWDTADTVPGVGVLPAVATVLAGLLLIGAAVASRAHVRMPTEVAHVSPTSVLSPAPPGRLRI